MSPGKKITRKSRKIQFFTVKSQSFWHKFSMQLVISLLKHAFLLEKKLNFQSWKTQVFSHIKHHMSQKIWQIKLFFNQFLGLPKCLLLTKSVIMHWITVKKYWRRSNLYFWKVHFLKSILLNKEHNNRICFILEEFSLNSF